MAISDWPAEERPRERLLAAGPGGAERRGAASPCLLRTGVRGKSAVDLGARAAAADSAASPSCSRPDRAAAIKGLGPAKTAQFAAAMELARRSLDEKLEGNARRSPRRARCATTCGLRSAHVQHEVFVCIWLDAQHR